MNSPDLSPFGAQFAHRDDKRSVSSNTTLPTTLAAVPEAHTLPSSLATPVQDFDPCIGAKPSSPFYRHATPSVSLARLKLQSKNPQAREVHEDPENIPDTTRSSVTGDRSHRDSKLWAQEKTRCGCMQSLSKKQQIILKAAIAIGTLGSMMAIALGITAAVGGGVWKSDHQHRVIG
ncbi:hypothetical protein EYZ11_006419 [Aspergillus tanneri]|uniref:Uncharacterized protein n=1 Tax=Aspergillus tanneri TaxID=1220188 RepID=A0A4S3JFW3_9EURO|nr:uncharacterized protein ATNIH1004_004773 [Aspergillus tanneri]KAA8648886.1 hypothetical protein ATNIH1004_004773 [Aspergillus tanneri]THC94090.1 hypothetical protein EYZ11_006419 [Aspergillus tanneri]